MRPIEIKSNQRAIAPFYEKLAFLLRFPFRPAPLIFLVCLVAASALAGLVLGPFGLVFRGVLIYLGLRYGFNVLDLFRKGRFEGESPDHSLWGSDTRPGKLGAVLALYVLVGVVLGNALVAHRVTNHPASQRVVLDAYQREHARDLDDAKRELSARRDALQQAAIAAASPGADEQAADGDERAWLARERAEHRAELAAELKTLDAEEAARGEYGRPPAEILRGFEAPTGSALWFKLLPAWYWAVMVALSVLLPAATLVIAIDDEFFKALNPTWVLHFARVMGAAYVVLWAFFGLIVGVRQLVLAVGPDWPAFVRLPVEMGLGGYLGLVLCALLGYVIYQYHQELHLDVEVDFDTHRHAGGAEAIAQAGSAHKAVAQHDPKTPQERQVQALVAAGRIDDAIASVKDEMRYDRLDPDLNDQLHALYRKLGRRDETLAHGQVWLRALVRAERLTPALSALLELRRLDAGFVPESAETLLPLARRAHAGGEVELARALFDRLVQRHPDHASVAQAREWAARLPATG